MPQHYDLCGRGGGVGRFLGLGALLAVAVARGVGVAVGVAVAVAVAVGVGVSVGLAVAVAVGVAVGVRLAVAVGVGVGVGGGCAQYIPPVFKKMKLLPTKKPPPQTIISLPVHTAVCKSRGCGAFAVLVDTQLPLPGSYLPPSLKFMQGKQKMPPHMIISVPVQTAL